MVRGSPPRCEHPPPPEQAGDGAQRTVDFVEGGWALEELPGSVHGTAARVYQVLAVIRRENDNVSPTAAEDNERIERAR